VCAGFARLMHTPCTPAKRVSRGRQPRARTSRLRNFEPCWRNFKQRPGSRIVTVYEYLLMDGFAFVSGGRLMLHDPPVANVEATRASEAHTGFRTTLHLNGSVSGRLARAETTADVWNRHGVSGTRS